MPNTVCWHCEALTQHILIGDPTVGTIRPWIDSRQVAIFAIYGAFRCASCNAIQVGIKVEYQQDLPQKSHLPAHLEESIELTWRPSPGMTRTYADVPEHIAAAATEAFECHARDHFRASILLARSVIESTAKAKEITKGLLGAKIAALYDQGWIRQHIKDGADSVRHLGNDMAHGDFVQPVTKEESALVIALMEEILDEVFQSRAKVTKAQAAVAARKKQQSQPAP